LWEALIVEGRRHQNAGLGRFNIAWLRWKLPSWDNRPPGQKVLMTTTFHDQSFPQMLLGLKQSASSKIKIEYDNLYLRAQAL